MAVEEEKAGVGVEPAPGGTGVRGAQPPNIQASKSMTTIGGRRHCMSSPSSELGEELGELMTCCDHFDLEEASASTTSMLASAASAVSELDREVDASVPEATRCSTSVGACTGSVLSFSTIA
ncbi:hypothetical protein AAC387_Pa02g3761 [Persea americana]